MSIVSTLSALSTLIVSWDTPLNGGSAIDQYQVQILTLQNTFANDSTCTGNITNGNGCLFDFAYLIQTYNFQVGQMVQFRARARNINGWGAYS